MENSNNQLIDLVIELVKANPNDMELGKKVRSLISQALATKEN